jgi:hypothetical protein
MKRHIDITEHPSLLTARDMRMDAIFSKSAPSTSRAPARNLRLHQHKYLHCIELNYTDPNNYVKEAVQLHQDLRRILHRQIHRQGLH